MVLTKKKRGSNPASLFFSTFLERERERERTHARAQRDDDIVERKKRGDDEEEEEERDAPPPPPPILLPKPLKLLSRERRKRGIPIQISKTDGIHFGET